MRKIDKGPEPKEWERYRQTPGARYQSFPFLVEALLEEQGYICAYCERRIPYRDIRGQEFYRIEHLSSQAKAREEGNDSDLDYNNMVICCPGNMAKDGPKLYHCDKKKSNKELRISPLSMAMMSTITFTPSGLVKSSDPVLNEELGEEGLNLNMQMLRDNRKEVWQTVAQQLSKTGWKRSQVEAVLEKWKERHNCLYEDRDGEVKSVQAFYPYCSMVIYMLTKKLRQGQVHG